MGSSEPRLQQSLLYRALALWLMLLAAVVYRTFSSLTRLFWTAIPNKLQHRHFYPGIFTLGVVQRHPPEKFLGDMSPETPAMKQRVVC